MFCQKCGAELMTDAVYCIKCGSKALSLSDFDISADKATDPLVEAVQKFQKGDASAFDTIYNESKRYIYYTIIKTTGDKEVTDDILQETYLDIYKSLNQLQSPGAFKGWAAKIAQHKISKHFQKKNPDLFSTEEELDSSIGDLVEEDISALPEDAMVNKEVQRLIGNIISDLPDNQRIAVLSFYYNQMSIQEIAESMGVPENTVKTYLFRGKKKIKEGVLEIEKKHGTKLYALPLAGLLGLIFTEEAKAAVVPVAAAKIFAKTSSSQTAVSAAADRIANNALKEAGKISEISVKSAKTAGAVTKAAGGLSGSAIRTIAICTTAGLLVTGGATAGIYYATSIGNEAYDNKSDNDELPSPIPDKEASEYGKQGENEGSSAAADKNEVSSAEINKNNNEEYSEGTDVKSQKDEEKEIIPTATEQKYIDEADALLKQDDPLSAAQVLTKAMMEDYYPAVYEKLKDIRRRTMTTHSKTIYTNLETSETTEDYRDQLYENGGIVYFENYKYIAGEKTVTGWWKHEIDSKGNAISTENYGNYESKYVTEFKKNSDGTKQIEHEGSIDGPIVSTQTYTDNDRKVIYQRFNPVTGELESESVYERNEDGNDIRRTEKRDGVIESVTEIKYDEYGRKIRQETDTNKRDDYYWTYKYTDTGYIATMEYASKNSTSVEEYDALGMLVYREDKGESYHTSAQSTNEYHYYNGDLE